MSSAPGRADVGVLHRRRVSLDVAAPILRLVSALLADVGREPFDIALDGPHDFVDGSIVEIPLGRLAESWFFGSAPRLGAIDCGLGVTARVRSRVGGPRRFVVLRALPIDNAATSMSWPCQVAGAAKSLAP